MLLSCINILCILNIRCGMSSITVWGCASLFAPTQICFWSILCDFHFYGTECSSFVTAITVGLLLTEATLTPKISFISQQSYFKRFFISNTTYTKKTPRKKLQLFLFYLWSTLKDDKCIINNGIISTIPVRKLTRAHLITGLLNSWGNLWLLLGYSLSYKPLHLKIWPFKSIRMLLLKLTK